MLRFAPPFRGRHIASTRGGVTENIARVGVSVLTTCAAIVAHEGSAAVSTSIGVTASGQQTDQQHYGTATVGVVISSTASASVSSTHNGTATASIVITTTAAGETGETHTSTANIGVTISATASGTTSQTHAGVASCQVNLSVSAAGINTDTTIPDETSNGNDILLFGSPQFQTDAAIGVRSTRFFSSQNDCGRIDNNFESTFQSPFSLSVWTKPHDGVIVTSNQYIFSAYSGNVVGVENWRWDLRQVGGKLKVSIINYPGSGSENSYTKETTNNVYSDGTQSAWTHVVVTVNSSAVPTIYVNGSAVALTTLTSSTLSLSNYDSTNDCVSIAGILTSSSDTTPIYEYDGNLDDIALWSTELTSTQVSNLYNSGNGTNLTGSSDLEGWWKMGDHSVLPVTHSGTATVSIDVTASASGTAFTTHSGTASCQVNLSASASGSVSTPPAAFNNYSANLDGTDDQIDVDGFNAYSLIGSGDFTVSLWVNMDTITNNRALMFMGGSSSDYFLLRVRDVSGYKFQVNARAGTSGNALTNGTSTVSTGSWFHVASTRTGTTVKLYVNGSLEATTTNGENASSLGTSTSNTTTRIGAFSTYTTFSPDAKMDEVAVWDSVLSATEITKVYNSGEPFDLTSNDGNYTSSADLQGYWRFEDNTVSGSNGTIADSSGNSRTATTKNGVTFSTDLPS